MKSDFQQSGNKMKRKILIIFYSWLAAMFIAPLVFATTLTVSIPCSRRIGVCPGTAESVSGPAQYVARLYNFALLAAGGTALVVITYGALQYAISAGNPARQEDARDRITQAVIGVILLFGAYTILFIINPTLVQLDNPERTLLKK